MKLNDLSRFGRLEVSDAEEPLREVLVVLRCQEFNRKSDVVKLELLSFCSRPIRVTFDLFLFDDLVEHEDCF